MRSSFLHTALLASAMIAATGAAPASAVAEPSAAAPLIPRELFFGEPERTVVRISPDGRSLSWLAPRNGVLNLWVAPVDDPAAARPLTSETGHPIARHLWAPDSKSLLFLKDNDGDENYRLFAAPVDGSPIRTLLSVDGAQVLIQAVSTRTKDRIAVSINDRDRKWPDVYALDLASGQRTLLLRNDGHLGKFLFDDDVDLRLATKPASDGGYDLYKVTKGTVAAEPYERIPFEEMQTSRPLGFSGDGQTLYWTDSRGRDTAALVAEDVASGKRRVIASDAHADLSDLVTDPISGKPLAYAANYLTIEYRPLDRSTTRDLAKLKRQLGNSFAIAGQSVDNAKWILVVDRGDAPYEYWLFDRTAGAARRLFVSRPDLAGQRLAPMRALEIRSRDGLKLVSYLTLPPGSDSNADGVPDHPLPMVLLVHGGPWNRSEFGFDTMHQMLANRGYAVLDTNFRGSTGFGKKFVSAGDGEWGRKMNDDLIDAVDWAVAHGIAARDKVAIMGSSYGGYATLAALSVTPDRFACGVDSAGPSNLQSLLAAMPAQWESMRKQLYRRMGDPGTEQGRAWLHERSPLNYADRIVRPLLVGQGGKDPRVKSSEAEQIVAALQKHGVPVTYVFYPNEGHGLRRAPNRLAWAAISEQFLSQCLGGRAEPIGKAMEGSSADVKVGKDRIAGLQQDQP